MSHLPEKGQAGAMDTPDEENLPGMTVRWGVLVKIQGWGLQI
ncbi:MULTISPECIES: hypothetical protein [unclassified Pseudomonas]|nr:MULTISPECIES: hypothetical protein [unclassified Pseudomonas]